MKCVDCQYLCAISGEPLPSEEREELQTRDPGSFIWLSCSKDIVQLLQKVPDVFEQVLSEWNCKGYQEFDPESAFEQTQRRQGQARPMWQKVAILVLVLLALVGSIVATLHFL
jgi:hypothetical protein